MASLKIFVSHSGNDASNGLAPVAGASGAGPFATLRRAFDEARALHKSQSDVSDVEIIMQPGRYFMDKPLSLGSEDGGTDSGVSVKLTTAGEGRARLIGGIELLPEMFRPVSDPAVRARFSPEAVNDVVVCDLKAAGMTNFGTLRRRGFTATAVTAHLQLFYGDTILNLARWPHDSWTRIALAQGTKKDEWGRLTGDLSEGFLFDDERPLEWAETDDLWIHGYWAYDWANSYEHVKSIDRQNKRIHTHEPYGLYSFRRGQRFYYLNILEEVVRPGDYYVDTKAGLLYMIPLPEREGAELFASVLEEPVIALNGVSNLTVENISIEASRDCGIFIRDCRDVTISSCTIKNIGNHGIQSSGSKNVTISSCDISNCGDSGAWIDAGGRAKLEHSGFVITNNHIHKIGLWSRCYVPGIYFGGCGATITHNLIHDGPHTAILFMAAEVVIEYNEIYTVCMETGDAGTIYTGRDYTFRGNAVRYNWLHHTGGYGVGTMGIYNDDCVSGTEMTGNLFHHVSRAVFLGGGVDFTVRNNVFVECRPAIEADGRGASTHPIWRDMVDSFMKERFYSMNPTEPPYSVRYPELGKIDDYYKLGAVIPPEAKVESNISVGGEWCTRDKYFETGVSHFANNLVDQDPSFVDRDSCDFRVTSDSKAYSLGFEQPDFASIGLTGEIWSAALPVVRCCLKKSPEPHVVPTPAVPATADIILIMKNTGSIPASGRMELFAGDQSSISGDAAVDFNIAPGETREFNLKINALEKTYVEARSKTAGVRPARLWFK